jgi:hypothetical protein
MASVSVGSSYILPPIWGGGAHVVELGVEPVLPMDVLGLYVVLPEIAVER